MSVHQVPYPGDGGGGSSDDDSGQDDGHHRADNRPDKNHDSGEPQPPTPETPLVKPGAPILDYQFGDSQGWNQKPGFTLGEPKPAAPIARLRTEEEPDLIDKYVLPLYEKGILGTSIGLAVAGAGAAGLALAGPSLLLGLAAAGAALSATFLGARLATILAGSSKDLALFDSTRGLFSPAGLPVFMAAKISGAADADALKGAKLTHQAYDVAQFLRSPPGLPGNIPEGIKAGYKVVSTTKNLAELGQFARSSHAGSPKPSPQPAPAQRSLPADQLMCIRKPGGPVRIIKP